MSKKLKTPLLQKYQDMYDKNPRSRVFAPLAEAYRSLGMLDRAFEILREGIKNNPDYVMGYLGLASCFKEEQQWQNVYSTLRPFVNSNRDNLRLQKLFSEACLELEHFEEALETFKYILFLNPKDSIAALRVRELEDRPLNRESSKKDTESSFKIEELDSESDEKSVEGWETLSLTKKANEKKEEAGWSVESFNVNELDSGISDDFEKSKYIEREDEEKESVITHTLVDLYCSQGHLEKATEVLERILELNPDDKLTLNKLEEIKELLVSEDDSEYIDIDRVESRETVTTEVVHENNDEHERLLENFEKTAKRSENLLAHQKIKKLESFLNNIREKSREKMILNH